MNRDQVIATLRVHEAELRRRGVQHAALFGSVARGDSGPASDIDILIELDPESTIDVFGYAGLKRYIGDLFPAPVDVVNRGALKSTIRGSVVTDSVYAF